MSPSRRGARLGAAAVALLAVLSAGRGAAAAKSADAPADAYFGPFAMSPLSIRSRIGLLGREYHERTISDRDLLHDALLVEGALRAWRRAYPKDSWLAPTFFHLEQLYQAVQTPEARSHALDMLHDVARNYPNTKEAHLCRARLAAGFPPLVAEAPLASPSPSPEAAAPASPTAAPTLVPTAQATPAHHPR